MAFNVTEFQSRMPLGGARPSLFEVQLNNPIGGLGGALSDRSKFLVRAAQIPAASVGNIPVQYFGRAVNFAGNRTFAPWTVTILNDEDYEIRNSMEEWSSKINGLANNVRDPSFTSPFTYKADLTVTQFSKTGIPLRTYTFTGAYPTEVDAISLDWGTEGIMEFGVTFQYDYWTVGSGGDVGNTLNTVINALT